MQRDFIHAEFVLNPTIDEIAAAASIHPVHLSRYFAVIFIARLRNI
jgi:AraC-like DNA-binding protein